MASYLGIDWGTHSSKWAFQADIGNPIIGSIWDSSVCQIDGRLHMFTLEERFDDGRREVGLKRKLIQDPDQSFWEGTRPKLGVTLGEAVTFSILSVLLDAGKTLDSKQKGLTIDGSLTIRFSHPNWIAEDNIRALACFRDAALVATSIFLERIEHTNEARTISMAVGSLREAVHRHRSILDQLPRFASHYMHHDYAACSRGSLRGCSWELVFESCAAGFPYLLAGERDTFEGNLRTFPASKRVRKLLVVDIGAGSTDAGYMVRTVRPRDATGIMRPLLIWVPAADALEIAGRWLTDKIMADFKQQSRRITPIEAEDFKTSKQDWYLKPFVREWTTLIGDHVAEYVRSIRDDICLPNSPELEVVLTGGSSIVSHLRVETLQQVIAALKHRGLNDALARATKLIDLLPPESPGKAYRDLEVAQLAVSLGASDPRLAELKAYPDGLV